MAERSSTDDLLSRLGPYLEIVRGAGGDILDEVGSELTQKAAGGITSLGLKTAGAIHRAVRNRFRRARAKRNLDEELASAKSLTEREAAHRRFLSADPHLRDSLAALLERRDYLLALQAYCDDLPISSLVPGQFRLGEVFIPPLLIPEVGRTRSQSVRRQNIWHNSRRRSAECGPRLGLMFRRRACSVASADVRVSFA